MKKGIHPENYRPVVFSGNTATYTNTFSGTGGGVQLRIAKTEIVYAK